MSFFRLKKNYAGASKLKEINKRIQIYRIISVSFACLRDPLSSYQKFLEEKVVATVGWFLLIEQWFVCLLAVWRWAPSHFLMYFVTCVSNHASSNVVVLFVKRFFVSAYVLLLQQTAWWPCGPHQEAQWLTVGPPVFVMHCSASSTWACVHLSPTAPLSLQVADFERAEKEKFLFKHEGERT